MIAPAVEANLKVNAQDVHLLTKNISNAWSCSQKSINSDHVIPFVLTQTCSHGLLWGLRGFPHLANQNESDYTTVASFGGAAHDLWSFPIICSLKAHLLLCCLQFNCIYLSCFVIYIIWIEISFDFGQNSVGVQKSVTCISASLMTCQLCGHYSAGITFNALWLLIWLVLIIN